MNKTRNFCRITSHSIFVHRTELKCYYCTMNISIWFIPFLFLSIQSIEVDEVSKLVNVLIKQEHEPAVLSVIACWSKLELWNFLIESEFPIQFNNQLKLSFRHSNDKIDTIWYLTDMRCDGSYEFLNNLNDSYFAHPNRWILFEPDENRMINLSFLTDSNVILVNYNADLIRFDLRQGHLYKIS